MAKLFLKPTLGSLLYLSPSASSFVQSVALVFSLLSNQLNMAVSNPNFQYIYSLYLSVWSDFCSPSVHQTMQIWQGKLPNSMCLLTQTFQISWKLLVSLQTSDGRSQRDPSWQGTFFPHCGLEILCVDDCLSPTRIDIQTGSCLSLRFNKTHHIVPH